MAQKDAFRLRFRQGKRTVDQLAGGLCPDRKRYRSAADLQRFLAEGIGGVVKSAERQADGQFQPEAFQAFAVDFIF